MKKDIKRLSFWEVAQIIDKVKFSGFKFHVFQDGYGWDATICVQGEFVCAENFFENFENNKSEPIKHNTRVWRIEPEYSETQVVKTVFNLVNYALEYELRSAFTYEGFNVFSPDFNVRDVIEDKKRLVHKEKENSEDAVIGSNEKLPIDVA